MTFPDDLPWVIYYLMGESPRTGHATIRTTLPRRSVQNVGHD